MNAAATVWAIAGIDSSGGAGLTLDSEVCRQLGAQMFPLVTATTQQNAHDVSAIHFTPAEVITAQLAAQANTSPAQAIKIGMLGHPATITAIAAFLKQYTGKVILDPVLFASSGKPLFEGNLPTYKQHLSQLFPYIDVFTPNLPEAEHLLEKQIRTHTDIVQAAHAFLAQGVKSVLIKGGHGQSDLSQDYWTNGQESFWLVHKRYHQKNYRGTGCAFSSALAASLALNHDLKDALVIAKMTVNQGIRLAQTIEVDSAHLTFAGWPEAEVDLPSASPLPLSEQPSPFLSCGSSKLGLYPVVDSSAWIEKLLPLGVKTIQLRIKHRKRHEVEKEIMKSVLLAQKYQARLFINDEWKLAIKHGAYGVHLGQEDLLSADIEQIRQARLRLGLSTHCYYEVARAHRYRPSYLACGPIFPTTSKIMPFAPQGLHRLQRWCRTLSSYPLVAIGGIGADNVSSTLATGVGSVAMISAITQAKDPIQQTRSFLELTDDSHQQ